MRRKINFFSTCTNVHLLPKVPVVPYSETSQLSLPLQANPVPEPQHFSFSSRSATTKSKTTAPSKTNTAQNKRRGPVHTTKDTPEQYSGALSHPWWSNDPDFVSTIQKMAPCFYQPQRKNGPSTFHGPPSPVPICAVRPMIYVPFDVVQHFVSIVALFATICFATIEFFSLCFERLDSIERWPPPILWPTMMVFLSWSRG